MNLNAKLEKAFAGRWIAGYGVEDALERTRTFNSFGISTLINFLGEDIFYEHKIRLAVETYMRLVSEIRKGKLKASISIKPTQLGLSLNYGKFYSNYTKILAAAKKHDVFVWLDMETPQNVDATIKAYRSAIRYGNCGICIQAYLKRSLSDVEGILGRNAAIRLVKGAYKADSNICYKQIREINSNYMNIMRLLFSKADRFMIATHDSRIVEEAVKINRKSKKDVTFAVLNGIRNRYAMHLARSGQKVAAYVPFGSDWMGYGFRRITEQRHLSLILRSLLEKQEL